MSCDCVTDIPGAAELSDWFGGFPSFHDAYAQLKVNGDGTGWIKLRGARMTNRTDSNGYFIMEKHFAALITIGEIVSVSLTDFMPGELIIGQLDILKREDAFALDIDTSYGLAGLVMARQVEIEFVPLPAGPLRGSEFPVSSFRRRTD